MSQPCPQCDEDKRPAKPELPRHYPCVVAAGRYENVNVEINERCQVVRLEPAEKIIVKACDSCA